MGIMENKIFSVFQFFCSLTETKYICPYTPQDCRKYGFKKIRKTKVYNEVYFMCNNMNEL